MAEATRTGWLKLRRIVSSESWVPEIDGLRFVAIMAVLFFHLSGEVEVRGPKPIAPLPHLLEVLLNRGDRGVALFFVISGFVLARPFHDQFVSGGRRIRLSSYFVRRLTRLEPPYLLNLLLFAVALYATHAFTLRELIPHTAASAFYLHNLIFGKAAVMGPCPDPHAECGVVLPIPNFVTWSLEVEVQFYIIAPLLGQIYRVRSATRRRLIWGMLTIAGCVWSARHFQPPQTLLTYAGFFPGGFLLADLWSDPEVAASRSRGLYRWDLAALAGWIAVFSVPAMVEVRAFLPLLIVPLYLASLQGKISLTLLRHPVLTSIGGMCYSLYLMHTLVMSIAFRVVRHAVFSSDLTTFLVQFTLLMIAVLGAGIVYFVLIERPCMNKRWPQELLRFFRSLRRTAQEPSSPA